MSRVSTLNRLTALRKLLTSKQLQAYIIPSEDEHFSEYVDPADRRYTFISGFTGSTCTAIVTTEQAALWVDGRYHLQGSRELDENWILMKQGLPDVPDEATWLASNTREGGLIGFDPQQLSFLKFKSLQNALAEAELVGHTKVLDGSNKRQLVGINGPNLVDLVWEEFSRIPSEHCQRPVRASNPITAVPVAFAGYTWQAKVRRLRDAMIKAHAAALVISALDEIAWLLNLRGSDIKCNPLFFAHLIVTREAVNLFLNSDTQSHSLSVLNDYLNDNETPVHLYPYSEFLSHLETVVARPHVGSERIWCDMNATYAIVSRVPEVQRHVTVSPVAEAKMIKCPQELDGIRSAHLIDSLVLCDFLAWLEDAADQNRTSNSDSSCSAMRGDLCEPAGFPQLPAPTLLTESSVADYLDGLRTQSPTFVSLSFPTISASDANSAIIHYRAKAGDDAVLTPSSMFLLDSGAQYLTGTTDVTRTLHLGQPTSEQKACYTMVLKAHIALARQVFPKNTPGSRLDVLSRCVLWNYACDYAHGTGHGVGAFLCVHEGPIGLSGRRLTESLNAGIQELGILKDMVLTIEPGYYLSGEFGIRLENVTFTVAATAQGIRHEAVPKSSTSQVEWLTFAPVTLVPFQRKLIHVPMLNSIELQWLNCYHELVREQLRQRMVDEQGGAEFQLHSLSLSRRRCWEWLVRETEPISQ